MEPFITDDPGPRRKPVSSKSLLQFENERLRSRLRLMSIISAGLIIALAFSIGIIALQAETSACPAPAEQKV